jgi:hypothetical protein
MATTQPSPDLTRPPNPHPHTNRRLPAAHHRAPPRRVKRHSSSRVNSYRVIAAIVITRAALK